ncbi:hypothetical protein ANN_01876 [Periplaneta americana]|uniref:Uncharacterized protein n=1 Tax=Periplaneta americana TaxID=6978 RepID=A0ABQ8TX47_PERAM|nr:hypothetical protein ANN_01876 [Periplaneta americana]
MDFIEIPNEILVEAEQASQGATPGKSRDRYYKELLLFNEWLEKRRHEEDVNTSGDGTMCILVYRDTIRYIGATSCPDPIWKRTAITVNKPGVAPRICRDWECVAASGRQSAFRGWCTWCVDKLQGFYRVVLVFLADVSTAVLWPSSEQLSNNCSEDGHNTAVETSAKNTKTTR